ncbi:MAG TPA: neutral zinc metallopeptidase [Actinoplanes sp.]|nr:neutral zinc metallopeptidase [Actinoplanes sp.]
MRIRPLASAAATLALLAGCAFGVDVDRAQPVVSPGGDLVKQSLRDVERFWTTAFPSISDGADFKPVSGGFYPYTRNDPPPPCGGQRSEYQPNAFYCPPDDFIAWDAQTLIPQLQEDFGPLLVGVVMAHEYGHAVQQRLRQPDQPTVVLEQQADCFAGAWVADVLAGRSTVFRDVQPAQLDDTVAGLLLLRDQPGTPALAPQAHGNAFDRVRAFQEGVEDGVTRCAEYRADNLPVTEVPFSTEAEAATGGDLPYEQAVTLLSRDVQDYWTRTFPELAGQAWAPLEVVPFETPPSCADRQSAVEGAFFCPSGGFVAFDNVRLGPALHRRIGDNAVGMLIGNLFARAAQDRRGRSNEDEAGQLAVDCLTGTWTNDLLTRDQSASLRLSPGDLDEAVAALLAFGRADGQTETTAFERIAAYRGGVLKGLSACS